MTKISVIAMRLTMPITTRRLILRHLTERDLDAVFQILNDEVTTARVSWRQPSREAAKEWLSRRILAERTYGISMLAIEDSAQGAVIGLCGFFPRDAPPPELAYVIHARHWGRGFGTEAVKAVVQAASEAGMSMYATIRPSNPASIRVAQKAGLTHTHTIEDERGVLLVYVK